MSEFCSRLREERERLGLTQAELASVVDSSNRTVHSWEQGVSAPNAHHLSAMQKCGFDLMYLISGCRSEDRNELLTDQETEWLRFFRSMTGKPEAQQLMIDFMRMTKANK